MLNEKIKRPLKTDPNLNEKPENGNVKASLPTSEQLLRTMANNSPVMIWMAGPDKLCHFFNQRWLDFRGRTLQQEMGNGWSEGVHPDDLGRCTRIFHTAFDAREEFILEYRLKRHDGEYRWISDQGVPNYNPNGEFEGYSGACMDIHDRIVFEEKLKESEARLRIAALSSELGTWDYNPLTQEMSWDSACKELFGTAQDTPVTLDLFWSKMHPDDQPAALESMLRALNPDIAENYESEYRIVGLPDDRLRWIRAKGRAFFDQHGNPVNFAGTVLDITEEKVAMEALQKNERKFRLLADALPQLIWTGDAYGRLDYYSQNFFDFSGMTTEQVSDNGLLEIIHPDEKSYYETKWKEAVLSGETFIAEHRLKGRNGEYRWQLSRAVAYRDEHRNILMWVGTSTDIHDQKMASRELEAKVEERTRELAVKNEQLNTQREFAEVILNSSVDIISVFDKEVRYLTINKKFEEVYQRSSADLIGKKLTDAFPAMVGSEFYNKVQDALKGKPSHIAGYQSLVAQRYYETYMLPLMSNDKVYAALVIAHDNTELMRAYHQLEMKNNELEKSNHNLEQFAYIASHDLQEPLRKIRTFSELLYDSLPNLNEQSKAYFEKIDLSAKRMSGLIKDVLNYSRLSTEQIFEKVNLNLLLEEIKSDFELTIKEKNAVLKIANLPELSGIALQLNQLFSNLIGNALKFNNTRPVIEIAYKEVPKEKIGSFLQLNQSLQYICITCSDNGIGFDEQYAEQIFNIFQRLNNRDHYEGTGIGLALCKKIMENHYGLIQASSEPGKGSVFELYFPVD